MTSEKTIERIIESHRTRRLAVKTQSSLERRLESHIRINSKEWEWDPDAAEEVREKINKKVKRLIKAIRDGAPHEFFEVVETTDKALEPANLLRAKHEKIMEQLAKTLPVYPWIESIRGAGALGLATIIAETGDLSNYPNKGCVWKRLGFAPYEGLAGSTWKREKWRPRALTKQEWVDNPFNSEKYALIEQIGESLLKAQVEAAEKSGTEFGRPKGPYGELYVRRREDTKGRPDWPKRRCWQDAIRYVMKAFLRDLWREWRRREAISAAPARAIDLLPPAADRDDEAA